MEKRARKRVAIMKNKTLYKMLSLLLVFTLLLSSVTFWQIPTYAAEETAGDSGASTGASEEIIAFGELATGIAAQNVTLGTDKSELVLPDTLTATVRLGLAEQNPGQEEEISVMDSVYTSEAAGSALIVNDRDKPEQDEQQETEEADGSKAETVDIPVPVSWTSSPKYDGNNVGVYTFTAGIEGFTLSAQPPSITVTVGEGTRKGTITDFDELADDIRWQNTYEPVLPERVSGMVEGKTAEIPVTWKADHDYDADSPETGLYVFIAHPGEGYTLAGGVEAPRITVYIPATPRMLMRMGGAGTNTDPLEITTAAQLAEIAVLVNAGRLESFLFNRESVKVSLKLVNDLDLSAYGQGYNGGKGWVPIGTADKPFKGSFDGNGMIISGLYINDNTRDYVGLFGIAESAAMKNLNLTAVSIHAETYVGGIAGCAYSSEIENCRVSGSFSGTHYIGGIAGDIGTYSTVQNCYTTSSVSGINFIGGVAGIIGYGSAVQNCYATGNINGVNHIGGIVGEDNGTVQYCAALNPNVEGTKDCGRVVGSLGSGYVVNNAAFSGMTVMVGGSKKTPSSFANGIDGADITASGIKADGTIGGRFTTANGWIVEHGKLPGFGLSVDMPDYITGGTDLNFPGAGTAAEPFLIGTAEKLAKLAELVNASATHATYGGQGLYYKLTADIDLSDYGASNTGFNSGKGWVPIGDNTNQFMGNLDGNGHAITGLYINNDDAALYAVGLFGVVKNGTLENFLVSGTVSYTVSGFARAGMVVGALGLDATLKNCYTFGSVTATAENNSMAGGLVGEIYTATMESCYTTVNVSATDYAGGLIGKGTVITATNCAALNSSVNGGFGVGCIVGDQGSYSALSGNIAFSAMQCTPCGSGYDNGVGKTADELQTVVGFPSAFTADPWTYESGKLPGLFGKTVEMPAHITAKLTSYFAGGDGSQGDPYQIATAAQLAKLAELVSDPDTNEQYGGENVYYKLTDDLDLSGYGASNTGFNGGKGWVPIGDCPPGSSTSFNGSFDGNYKTITGLYINDSAKTRLGLFGRIYEGSVKNLGLTNVNITGNQSVGGIAAIMSGKIENCYVSGKVSGTWFVGGIAGSVYGILQNCYVTGSVGGTQYVGGIAGGVNGGLQNCYSTASVITSAYYAGGIAGIVYNTGTVKNCAALNPKVSAGAVVGRVAGSVDSGGTLAGNRAFSGMIGGGNAKTADGTDGADISAVEINTAEFWYTDTNWDSTATWANPAWNFQDGYLPLLKRFGPGAQSGDGGLYLTERDIANATVNVGGPYTYTGSAIEPNLAVTFDDVTLVKDKDYTVAITSADDTDSGTSAGTNAGEVTITLTGKGNFCGTTTEYYTIDHKTPTAADLTYNLTAKTSYNGLAQPLSVAGKTAGLGAITVKYDGSTTAPKDAKTYAVTVSIAESTNYAAADITLGDYTITKAALTITSGTVAAKTYDGTTSATISGVTFSGLQNSETLAQGTDYTVTVAAFDSADAGSGRKVTATVVLSSSSKAANYTLNNGSLSISGQTIDKAVAPTGVNQIYEAVEGHAKNYEFDLTTLLPNVTGTLGTVTYTPVITENSDGVLGTLAYTSGTTLTIPVQAAALNKTATITVGVTSGNYNDFTAVITVKTVAKTPVSISGVTMTGGVYNGNPYAYTGTPEFTLSTGGAPVNITDFDVLYTSSDSGGYSSEDAPTNAGVYQLKISVPDSNMAYTGSQSHSFTIEKCPVAVRADDQSMIRGGTLPTFTYTVDGQLSEETALAGTPTLTCAADGKTTGSYPITVDLIGVSYTANYMAAIPGSVNGTLTVNNSSGGGGGSSGSGGTSAPAETPNTETNVAGNTATATTTATAAVDSSGNAAATVSRTQVSDAIGKVMEEAEKQGEGTVARVEIKVEAPADVWAAETSIPQESVRQASETGIGAVTIATPVASITFDANAFATLSREATGNVKITASRVAASSLSPEAQRTVGDRPVFDFTVTSGDRTISQFGGDVLVSVPYTPREGEDTNAIVIYYINDSGELEIVSNGIYDPATGRISFSTRHFSKYAVGYNKVTFQDVAESAWYSKAVGFIAAREITTGSGGGNFGPEVKLTRGQFIVMLMKAYGIAPDADPKDNFADAGDTYYTGYLAAAKRLSISGGVGNNMFAPDKEITRQEMLTLLYNALKVIGRLPEGTAGKQLSAFTDARNIAPWAREAMALLVETGVIGGNGGKLSPASTTTRAEMAQVLYKLLSK